MYRAIESLYVWCIPVCNRLPKDLAFRCMGERLVNELTDACTTCALALRTANAKERLDILEVLTIHMTNIKSIVKTWFEWSSKEGQVIRIVSRGQHIEYLKQMDTIGIQLGAWMRKTAEKL